MKKLFWVLFVFLFVAVVVYAAASGSLVSLKINSNLALVISVFVLAGLFLGFLGGKNRYKGMPRKKLPDKGEFLLCCLHGLRDTVLLYLMDRGSEKARIFEIGKKQLLDKDGQEISDFTKFPREFIVMKRSVGGENGPVRTVYYIIPM